MSDYTNIIQEINTNIPDNTDQSITALKVRTTLIDMLDAVDDNMTEAIGEISVPTKTSDLTNDSGFITATSLEPYVTKTELSNESYVTQNELNSASYVTESQLQQAGYVTQSALNSMSYATTAFVDDAIADAFEDSDFMTETDVNNLLSTASYVTSEQLSAIGYITNQDLAETLSSATYVTESQLQQAGYVSQSDISNMGYVTGSEIAASGYVTQSALNSMSYVTGSEISNMGYVSQNDLQSQLADYVTESQLNNASYVNTTQLNEAISGITVPTKTSDLTNDSGFITASALNGYATEAYVTNAIADINTSIIDESIIPNTTSTYTLGDSTHLYDATYTECIWLSERSAFLNTSYAQIDVRLNGSNKYVFYTNSFHPYFRGADVSLGTSTNQWAYTYSVNFIENGTNISDKYATKTELSNAGYVSQSQLSQAGYVSHAELNSASYATETYVSDYVAQHAPTPDLSAYVTKTELNNASYVTSSDLSNMGYLTAIPSEYVTESELSAKSYATTSQLATKQDTLVSGTNIKTVNNNSLLGSGNITISSSGNLIAEVTMAEYEAMQQAGTLDPNTIYVITDAPATDLSYYAELTYVETYYVSKEQLNSASYVTASALSNMSYATTSQLSNKQDTLVSGTNIKTINNESLLGSGNITISGSGEANVIESISVNGTTQTVTNKNVDITVPTNTNQLTNGAGFLTSAIFQYDSSTYTLTISI